MGLCHKGEKSKELTFNFYTIEDAISFTEQIVAKSCDTNEMLEKYISMFKNEEFKKTYSKRKKQ